jgi:TetR/AcrR family transcriptional regulator, transcriptional repressor for nem operon
MRVSKEKLAKNRERILTAAARLFRERGGQGAGVDALMQAAGLTHGSLYSHFGSKDALMAEALSSGFAHAQSRTADINTLESAVTAYLSATHRDNPGSGCFMAAIGCEMPRQNRKVRTSFTEIVRRSMARHAALIPGRLSRQREDEALATIAAMVGAIVLARAVNDPSFSDRILAASRERLLEHVSDLKRSANHDPSAAD